MNLRCLFHVSPARSGSSPTIASREPMPSLLDLEVDFVAEETQQPRGRSFETWTRARGWASED